jgi:hypothetical protein
MSDTEKTAYAEDAFDWDEGWDDDPVTSSADAPLGQDGALQTNVDIVFAIDVTGSMAPCLKNSTALAADLLPRVREALGAKKRRVDQMRVRVVAFRDYYCDDVPMEESPFYTLPGQEKEFHDFLDGLTAMGGGDAPENALEALHKAITSDWVQTGAKRRHIVVLMTDTTPHPLDHPKRAQAEREPNGAKRYPADMPRNLTELMLEWDDGQGKLNPNARRMAIFAPEDEVWRGIDNTWELATLMPCRAGEGLAETDMDVVVRWIADSI